MLKANVKKKKNDKERNGMMCLVHMYAYVFLMIFIEG